MLKTHDQIVCRIQRFYNVSETFVQHHLLLNTNMDLERMEGDLDST